MSGNKLNKRSKNEHSLLSSSSYDSKPVVDPELQHILRCRVIDEEAVMKIIQKKPYAAKAKYQNFSCYTRTYFPLHIAVDRNASFNLVNFLHKAFPGAVEEKINSYDEMALHWACRFGSSFDVVSFLLEKYPPAAKLQGHAGRTPLHYACIHGASAEIVSLLLEKYPEAAKIQDKKGLTPLHHASSSDGPPSPGMIELLLKSYPEAVLVKDFSYGMTPLHHACEDLSPVALKLVALMLEKHPEASMIVDDEGNTPLHTACSYGLSAKMLSLLLEKYPFAVCSKNREDRRPVNCWIGGADCPCNTDHRSMILTNIGRLANKSVDKTMAMEIIKDFAQIKWWGGVGLVFDLYPPIFETFEGIPLSIMPNLLSMMGRRCKMLTVWNMLISRQDVLKIN